MNTQQVAHDLVALCKQGKFDEAGEKYWADDVVSIIGVVVVGTTTVDTGLGSDKVVIDNSLLLAAPTLVEVSLEILTVFRHEKAEDPVDQADEEVGLPEEAAPTAMAPARQHYLMQ